MKRPDFPGAGIAPRTTRPTSLPKAFQPVRKMESDAHRFTVRRRRRRASWLIGIGTFLALILIVTGIVLSPLLTLTEVIVKGRESVETDVVVGSVSDQIGKPLASLNFDSIRDRLATVARIQSFTTEIQPPHTLVIRIVERQAIGYMSANTKWSIVDAAGVVIDTVISRPMRLPELSIPSTADRGFTAITETLKALPDSLRRTVQSITATSRDTVRFTIRGSGHRITWGSPDNSSLKVLVMDRALEVARRDGGVYEIDVSAPDNIVLQRIG